MLNFLKIPVVYHFIFILFSLFVLKLLLFSHQVVSDSFVTPWTVARQAPLPVGFPRQEHLPDPGIEPEPPASPALAGGFFTAEPPRKPMLKLVILIPVLSNYSKA